MDVFFQRFTQNVATIMNPSLQDVVELSEDEADGNKIGSREPSALHSVVLNPPAHLDDTLAEVAEDKPLSF